MTAAVRAPGKLPAWAQPKEMLDLVRLAVPVAVSRASFMLMSLTDAIVLARHRPGELPLVLNAWLPNGVFMGFGLGLVLGVSVMTAELNGSGKGAETGRILRRGLMLALLWCGGRGDHLVHGRALYPLVGFGAELSKASAETTRILGLGVLGHMVGAACSFYLEALRKPNIVTAISMSAVVVNLVCALVLVPQFGAIGVVWGTTISRFYMMLVFLSVVWLATPGFRPAPKGPAGGGRSVRRDRLGRPPGDDRAGHPPPDRGRRDDCPGDGRGYGLWPRRAGDGGGVHALCRPGHCNECAGG